MSELVAGFEQLAELPATGSLADIADARAEAADCERARCSQVVRKLLAVYKVGMAAGVLEQALREIEGAN